MARRRLALFALWLLVRAAATTWAGERVGTVAELDGRAEAQRAGETAWVALAIGDPVLLGDQLRTLAGGKLRIALREDSALTLGAGSQLAVTEQLLAPATVSRFQLLLGTIKAAVTRRYAEPQARFELETPTAIAGVRGTSFIATYDPAEDETLVVGVEDVTRVRGRADPEGVGEVELGPGRATRVRRGRRPLTPSLLPESRFRTLENGTRFRGEATGPGPRRANRLDARRPQRAGQRAFSTEERTVDQPLFQPRRPKPPPPPPPVPPGGR